MMDMKIFAAKSPIGLFAFAESGDLVYFEPVPPEKMASLKQFPESFIKALKDYEIEENNAGYAFLRSKFRELAKNLTDRTDEEIVLDVIRFSKLVSKNNLTGSISRDRLVVQANNALDDINKTLNLYNERIYEWFSLHYPELKKRDPELIAKYGRRDNFPGFKESFGVPLNAEDEKALKGYSEMILIVEKEKASLEKYISGAVADIMPNASSVVEPLLAAKLLSHAGSLERMAKMPASTIQLLGAEKALFRHLRKKGKSPKFGILFSDRRIQDAEREKQGKIARLIASKLMMAIRIDFYSDRKEPKLRESLDKEIERI